MFPEGFDKNEFLSNVLKTLRNFHNESMDEEYVEIHPRLWMIMFWFDARKAKYIFYFKLKTGLQATYVPEMSLGNNWESSNLFCNNSSNTHQTPVVITLIFSLYVYARLKFYTVFFFIVLDHWHILLILMFQTLPLLPIWAPSATRHSYLVILRCFNHSVLSCGILCCFVWLMGQFDPQCQ